MTSGDTLKDVELRSVCPSAPLNRSLVKDAQMSDYSEKIVIGRHNDDLGVMVAYTGDLTKPAILTYHDLGLNYVSNFQTFFNYPEMREILANFCVLHINAPGQEDGCQSLDQDGGGGGSGLQYPTMDDLAQQVNDVLNEFNIVKYIGLGVGLGANILVRHAFAYPERVNSLILINCCVSSAGWIEWGYQKRNISHLKSHGVSQAVLDYLTWHHFGTNCDEARPHDLRMQYQEYLKSKSGSNGLNLAKLIESYINREAIQIQRDALLTPSSLNSSNQKVVKVDANIDSHSSSLNSSNTLKVPVLNIVGSDSPFVDETVNFNGKLNPSLCTWMKIQDCAMVLEEQPSKVAQAMLLFLQGDGFCLKLRRKFPSTA